MSGWHVMPVTQPLVGLPSPCSGCQMPSPPSSVCLPSSNLLLHRREAALLGKDFLSERMLMPSLPGCSSVSLLCCSFCSLCRCVSHLSQQNVRLWATSIHSLRDSLFNNLVAQFVGSSTKSVRKASTSVWVRRAAKAAKRGARWQLLSSEESHEASGKGLQALVEDFERSLTADSVAQEHRDKVDHLIAPEATTGKTHTLTDGIEDTLSPKIVEQSR